MDVKWKEAEAVRRLGNRSRSLEVPPFTKPVNLGQACDIERLLILVFLATSFSWWARRKDLPALATAFSRQSGWLKPDPFSLAHHQLKAGG